MTHNQIVVACHLIPHLECTCGGDGVIDLFQCRHGGECDCNDQVALCACSVDGRTQGVMVCVCCGEFSAEAVDERLYPHCKRCGDDIEGDEAVARFLAGGPGWFVFPDEE